MAKEKGSLKIISLGGFSRVTRNMFVYETPQDILLVDCGVGFPNEEMLGVDLVIPDIKYLLKPEKKRKIRGLILTHGHEDHIGAVPYILPKLPPIPIFGSRLTVALVKEKLKERKMHADLRIVNREKELVLGDFRLQFIQVTHSIPETLHLFIRTPYGHIYHGTDFKFDWTPIDGTHVEVEKMVKAREAGVDLLLSDCLRSEREGYTPSERSLVNIFEREIAKAKGRFLVTTMSSNLSRLKTAINVSRAHHRRLVLVGRSIRQAVRIGRELGYIDLSPREEVKEEKIGQYPPSSLTLLVAGSQAQVGSALHRIANGENRHIKIMPGDTVVFSSDYIPGNESSIQQLIDLLMRKGATVSYIDIVEDLHVSGHGAQGDLSLLINLLRPKKMLPIGGNFRQMKHYSLLAQSIGYRQEDILLPDEDESLILEAGKARLSEPVETHEVMVDGLGVGDVGNVVLRDREILAREGVVTVVLGWDKNKGALVFGPQILSRGFIYEQMKDGQQIISLAKKEIMSILKKFSGRSFVLRIVREEIKNHLEKFFYRLTGRWPMILVVIVEF